MNPTQIGALLVSALVGGLINELRHLLQLRRENRRTLNRVLFAQLEVLYRVRNSSLDSTIQLAGRLVGLRYGMEQAAAFQSFLATPGIRGVFQRFGETKLDAELEGQYQRAVSQLVDVDPVLAYQLNGRTALAKYRAVWEDFVGEVKTIGPSPLSAADHNAMGRADPVFVGQLRDQVVKILEEDVRLVARRLGWRTRWRTRKSLNRARAVAESASGTEVDKGLQKELDGILRQLEQAIAASDPAASSSRRDAPPAPT